MKTWLGIIVGVSQIALLCLNSCAVLCVHSDGNAHIEWSHAADCHSDPMLATSLIGDDHGCVDHALLESALQHPHRSASDFSALNLAPIPNAPHLNSILADDHCSESAGNSLRAPPLLQTLRQLRTVVILC